MASTTTQPAQLEAVASANPLVLWHLLSLDAPSVATLWTAFVARTHAVHLPWTTLAAMFLAVWALYAADRLLDARTLGYSRTPFPLNSPLEARHLFHHRHRTRFLLFLTAAALLLAALLPRLNPEALKLFLVEAFVLLLWFLTLHATPFARHLPKELGLGPFFATAVYIPTLARLPGSLLHLLPEAFLFASLCTLNCLFIHRWEAVPCSAPAHSTTQFAARYTTHIAGSLVALGAACATLAHTPGAAVAAACSLSAAGLLLLDRMHPQPSRTTLRAAADAALLTPLLLLLFAP